MPFNGVGVFSPNYNWENDQANGILVRADRMDTQDADIATGLSTCLLKDGTQTVTANIPMNSGTTYYKFTGLAYGTSTRDSVNYDQVFNFANSDTFKNLTLQSGGTFDATAATTCKVPTAAAGDNSTNACSTAFAQALAFQTALPVQTGASGSVVTTNGSVASWQSVLPCPELWM